MAAPTIRVEAGDMLEVLPRLAAEGVKVHAVICDPPYHLTNRTPDVKWCVACNRVLGGNDGKPVNCPKCGGALEYQRTQGQRGFMGKQWDGGDIAFRPATWRLCYDLLPPGGYLLAFASTRTYHRIACAIEDAGFEIRDMLAWLYGSGFPKSHNVSKAIDKARDDRSDVLNVTSAIARLRDAAGLTNADLDSWFGFAGMAGHWTSQLSQPSIPTIEQWEVLRGRLYPPPELDAEVWRLNGRKGQPGEAWAQREITGTVEEWTDRANYAITSKDGFRRDIPATAAARQWDGWGTALKPAMELICMARRPLIGTVAANVLAHGTGALNIDACRVGTNGETIKPRGSTNLDTKMHEGWARPWMEDRKEVQARHDTAIDKAEALGRWPANVCHDNSAEVVGAFPDSNGQAGAVRGTEPSEPGYGGGWGQSPLAMPRGDSGSAARFFFSAKADKGDRLQSLHPTVKPVDLMRWLVRLVTPPGGTVLDCFAGSGTTAMACMAEGFDCIAVEREAEYVADLRRRIAHVHGTDTPLFMAAD